MTGFLASEGLRESDRPCCDDARDLIPRNWSCRALGIVLLQGPMGVQFLMSEVP
jgi:hypothetical protein